MPLDASRNSLVLPILGLLVQQPAHAYDLSTRLRERCAPLTVTRSTVTTLLKSLARAGLVRARKPGRVGNRPPRTVYEATAAGVACFREKLEVGLRDTPAASVDFVLAVGFAEALAPDRAAGILDDRARRLAGEVADDGTAPLEEAYWRGIVAAEIDWLATLVGRIRSGEQSWGSERSAGLPFRPDGVPSAG
ncbi:PadR family transcriptional regulator [Actinoplanes rectilineatus]|uniref:PadR family transcriptional regulator n=1 Tax=Actinoplanes rectilineatus TaxID=113571 RepID=UPI0005F2E43C|nr:PadR family transcriptional regulator [Actinoplanes rectilineatus]